jgi:membrane protein
MDEGARPRIRDVLPSGPRAWVRFGRAVWREVSADHVILLAAGVAFFAFISIFPTMVATGLVYGLVSDPDEVAEQVEAISDVLPEGADELLTSQLEMLTEASQQSLGFGLFAALATALWAASTATSNLLSAVNAAHDHTLRRSFARRRALGLAMTIGGITFVTLAVGLIAVAPAVFELLDLPDWTSPVLWITRWIGLVITVIVALALVYRFGPYRSDTRIQWVSLGAVVATVLWIVASAGFALYVNQFADYGSMYGQMSGAIVLLLWLWLGGIAALVGAEVNAEVERRQDIATAVASDAETSEVEAPDETASERS